MDLHEFAFEAMNGQEDYVAKARDEAEGMARDMEHQMEQIGNWWADVSASDIDRTVPKAVEYGAFDLDIMAQAMISLLPIDTTDMDEAMKIGRYAATQFYALGKVARAISALAEGRLPGPDSEFDGRVYQIMAQRIRETGRWV